MNYTVFDIASYILEKYKNKNISLKKLQKLCYYIYSWYVYSNNEDPYNIENRIFKNDFEAWVHGPVSVSLYNELKDSEDIFNIKASDIKSKVNEITESNIVEHIEEVLNVYNGYTADQLESISHQERPWQVARVGCNKWDRCNTLIEDSEMFKEYALR